MWAEATQLIPPKDTVNVIDPTYLHNLPLKYIFDKIIWKISIVRFPYIFCTIITRLLFVSKINYSTH